MKEEREFGGYAANGCHYADAVKIELGESINGSGPEAFNGAKSWPTLRLAISFQVGEEDKMKVLASRFEMILRESGIICEMGEHWLWDHCPGCRKGAWKSGFCDECKKAGRDMIGKAKVDRCHKCGKALQVGFAMTGEGPVCSDCL